jgi:two-component system, OmpR family, sensor histidine kinase CpxA
MRSLFCKLFASFVFITLLASVTTAMISYWAQVGPYGELMKRVKHHQYQTLEHLLTVNGLAAVKILDNGGEDEVRAYLQEVEKIDTGHVFLLKNDNSTFSGRTLPAGARDLAAASRRSQATQYNITETEVMVALPLPNTDWQGRIIVGTMARIFWPPGSAYGKGERPWPGPFPLGLPLIVMLLIAGTGCYLLARSLTAPIRDLRRAAWRITKGDFSARVDLLSRRGDEIADLSRDFNTMVEKTQSLLQSQKRLLRDISHELRSPLTRLNVALELARQNPVKAESHLQRIEKESDRLNELIGQLLILIRLEGDMDNMSKEPVNLQKLVTDIVYDADFEAAGRERKIQIQHLDDVTVLGTVEMLGRALENVIRNGLRYTAAHSAVEVSVTKSEGRAAISIRDHGPGVPDECLEQIFKPFFRVAESRDRDSGGTGIGLAIAKQAILMHGGSIEASNAGDGGLVVQMSLPLM